MDIFDGFAFDNEDDKKDIAKSSRNLRHFASGKTNKTFERYTFNRKVNRSMRMCLNCVN
jgi:hypothetical protein